jgi:hypothetical protein
MGRPRRRGRGRSGPFTGKPDGLQPGDDIGNRRSFKQQQNPPDDLGNRKESEESRRLPADDIGNRIDAAPTHEVSGVLAELDGRRRRRKKGNQAQRMGRYIVGGVNPMVAGNVQRAVEAMEKDEQRRAQEGDGEGRRGRRRRRRRRDARDHVDGEAAQEVSQRRAQRFFDFDEDDRFDYELRSKPEDKRKAAEEAVTRVLAASARDATVTSRVVEDGDRPKVLVAIDDRGPAAELPADQRADNAAEPLFVLGNAALMSLNYLVNKIINRYPDDRIRLAILPKADEALYLDSLAEHRKANKAAEGAGERPKGNGATAPQTPAEAALPENETEPVETSETAPQIEDADMDAAGDDGVDKKAAAKKKTAKKAAKKAATKKATKKATTKKATKKAPAKKKATKKAADEE